MPPQNLSGECKLGIVSFISFNYPSKQRTCMKQISINCFAAFYLYYISLVFCYGGGLIDKVMSNSWDPMDCILPGSSVHGILQARILEWVAIYFSRGSSQPRNRTHVSCIADRLFTD